MCRRSLRHSAPSFPRHLRRFREAAFLSCTPSCLCMPPHPKPHFWGTQQPRHTSHSSATKRQGLPPLDWPDLTKKTWLPRPRSMLCTPTREFQFPGAPAIPSSPKLFGCHYHEPSATHNTHTPSFIGTGPESRLREFLTAFSVFFTFIRLVGANAPPCTTTWEYGLV
ncbi:hypothetical protein N658DRAFT_94619 [Parathielavia hyrcaniae]|uniref:Uncharacterized protein n=1 Tax=Parathielavia hyrcaniae TaxID=113614 RepID=A0AAN6T0Y6_9PEZI|nr:hypothetical protein N658DRAFT_94619 [Parathielavia hyrcaniae]